jgi:hypothetical protein
MTGITIEVVLTVTMHNNDPGDADCLLPRYNTQTSVDPHSLPQWRLLMLELSVLHANSYSSTRQANNEMTGHQRISSHLEPNLFQRATQKSELCCPHLLHRATRQTARPDLLQRLARVCATACFRLHKPFAHLQISQRVFRLKSLFYAGKRHNDALQLPLLRWAATDM